MTNTLKEWSSKKSSFRILRERYTINAAIFDMMHNDPYNTNTWILEIEAIEGIKKRIFPTTENKLNNKLSAMDAYYIHDELEKILTDKDLYQILNWILCKPQYFWHNPNKPEERIITNEWLKRLNDILDWAARHTIRQMEQATNKHNNELLNINQKEENKIWGTESIENNSNWTEILPEKWPRISYFERNFWQRIDVDFSQKDKKYKIHFNIKSLEDFILFSRNLLSTSKEETTEFWKTINNTRKSLWTIQKNWLFAKNIIIFSDMIRNDVYTWKRTLFPDIIRDVFYPILNINKDKTEQNTTETQDHELEFFKKFKIQAYGKSLSGDFIFCTKPQSSIIDKCRRDTNYSNNEDLQDILRWSIIMDKHENLILMMHYIIKYFIKNPERKFDHSTFNEDTQSWISETNWLNLAKWTLRNFLIKDKWILNTEIEKRQKHIKNLPKWTKPEFWKSPTEFNEDELDWVATKFLIRASNNKKERKLTNAEKYIDSKFIIPIAIRSNLIRIELKFLVRKSAETNDAWLQNHKIMRLKEKIKLRSRDEKHVSADKIKYEINLLLQDEQLKRQIQQEIIELTRIWEDIKTPEKFLYEDLTKNLIIIKSITTESWWIEGIEFCDREIRNNLQRGNYAYGINELHNALEKTKTRRAQRKNMKKKKKGKT